MYYHYIFDSDRWPRRPERNPVLRRTTPGVWFYFGQSDRPRVGHCGVYAKPTRSDLTESSIMAGISLSCSQRKR